MKPIPHSKPPILILSQDTILTCIRNQVMSTIYPIAYFASKIASFSLFNITVIGQFNVPLNDPLILSSTHCNMVMDPAILISTVPNHRQNHYWAKKELWLSKVLGFIFDGLGAIPVTRSIHKPGPGSLTKNQVNNSELWLATTKMLQSKEMVVVFPEGTSYTLPHLIEFKDGISKAALNYASHAREHNLPPAHIIPVGITYLDKTKWRSQVIVIYGRPIDVTNFIGKSVRDLTLHIQHQTRKVSLNAPDWETLQAAKLAYSILDATTTTPTIEAPYYLFLDHVTDATVAIPVLQGFIALFSDLSNHAVIQPIRARLIRYNRHLEHSKLKDVTVHLLTPKKGQLIGTLGMASLRVCMYLPVVVPGLVLYAHVFAICIWLNRGEVYKEVYSQNKGLSGIIVVPLTHMFWLTVMGNTNGYIWVELCMLWITVLLMWIYDDFLQAIEVVCQIMQWAAATRDDRQELIAERATIYADVCALVPLLPTSASFFNAKSVNSGQPAPVRYTAGQSVSPRGPSVFINEAAYTDLAYGPFLSERSTPPPALIPPGKYDEPTHMPMNKRAWVDVACDLMAVREWAEARLERYSWVRHGI